MALKDWLYWNSTTNSSLIHISLTLFRSFHLFPSLFVLLVFRIIGNACGFCRLFCWASFLSWHCMRANPWRIFRITNIHLQWRPLVGVSRPSQSSSSSFVVRSRNRADKECWGASSYLGFSVVFFETPQFFSCFKKPWLANGQIG